MVLIYFVTLMTLAIADTDPTKVCIPDQVQLYTYTIETDKRSLVIMDFNKNLMGSFTGNSSIVLDLANKTSYITHDSVNCHSGLLPPNGIFPQCLPADAVKLGDVHIGLRPSTLPVQGWQYPIANGILKVAFSNQTDQPRFPVLTRYSDDKGITVTTFYFNVTMNITRPELLRIPDLCPPWAIV